MTRQYFLLQYRVEFALICTQRAWILHLNFEIESAYKLFMNLKLRFSKAFEFDLVFSKSIYTNCSKLNEFGCSFLIQLI